MHERELWSLRVDEATTRDALRTLDAQLVALGAAWTGALRFKIGAKLTRLKATDNQSLGTEEVFAKAYGLPAADGRWLYRYRLTSDAFARLQADLAQRSTARLEQGYAPALFVLWASEWFRRCYRGGGHRWVDLAAALSMTEDQSLFRRITSAGLRTWHRPVIAAGGGREFLGSLAREGGFPTAAVEDGGGWALGVLKAIVAPMLTEPAAGEDRARELATMQKLRLPQLFRDDEFVALCADLALAIVNLRREADGPAAAADLPAAAWLELHHPGWQASLPLSTSDKAAEALLERLMKVEAVSGATISVERLLQLGHDRVWREAARLTLDGALDSAATRTLDSQHGRLRVFAAGELARSMPGELAMLEAPAEGEAAWTARSTRRVRGTHLVPFTVPIELDLRSGEQRVARIALAGGKPRRGALIVAEIEGNEPAHPTFLRVVGSGSGKYRAETVVLQAPADWRVDATGGEKVQAFGAGAGNTLLWRVSGGAFVTAPDGDRFRLLCGQPQNEPSRIELIGRAPAWAEVAGDVDLFVGSPMTRIGQNGGLCIRAIGERSWQPAPGTLPIGHYDIGWRRDGITLDRRRVAILPAGAEVVLTGSPKHVSYQLSGFGVCSIDPGEDAPVRVVSDTEWRAQSSGRIVHWFTAHVEWPESPSLAVRINHPTAASIARWDGSVLPDQTRVTLADLPDLVAVNDGRVQMVGELVQSGRRVADMTWEVVDELPMASISADLASLLLPGSIDAEVRLGMHDGIETWWRVRQFAVEISIEDGAVLAPRGVATEGAELVGRALGRPDEEVSFSAYSLLTDANHRPFPLPSLPGDWLIYLRSGDAILSRPRFHRGDRAADPCGVLGQAMSYPQGPALDNALLDVLTIASHDDEAGLAALGELLALVVSLHGLPPATFRILELLVQRSGTLTRLAITTPPSSRDAVMALSDALPFAWCTIPRHHWLQAQGELFGRTLAQLSMLGGDAARYAKEAVDTVVQRLVDREPLLRPILLSTDADAVADVAQSFLNRAVDRIPRSSGHRYRGRIAEYLPRYFDRFNTGVLDTLDAPCAAAAATVELWTPQPDDIRHIKTVARTFPTYFADAFAASLKEMS
jgi:hypothetical protein